MPQTEGSCAFLTVHFDRLALFTRLDGALIGIDFLSFLQCWVGFAITIDVCGHGTIRRLITVRVGHELIAQGTGGHLNILAVTRWTFVFIVFDVIFTERVRESNGEIS